MKVSFACMNGLNNLKFTAIFSILFQFMEFVMS